MKFQKFLLDYSWIYLSVFGKGNHGIRLVSLRDVSALGVIFPHMFIVQVTSCDLGVSSWKNCFQTNLSAPRVSRGPVSCRNLHCHRPIPRKEFADLRIFKAVWHQLSNRMPKYFSSTVTIVYRNSEYEDPGRLRRFPLSSFSVVY